MMRLLPFRRRSRTLSRAEQIAAAEAARAEKIAALHDALSRRDTRAEHDRFPAAFAATCEALRIEAQR